MASALFNAISHKTFSAGALALSVGFISSSAIAHDTHTETSTASEKFRLSLGSNTIYRADNSLSLTERNLGTGVSISPTETLGVDMEISVFKLDSHYKISEDKRIELSWYKIDNDASTTLDSDINWINDAGEEVTIEAGTSISSSLTYSITKAGYYWSFYQSDKVELTFGGGLHITEFEVGIDSISRPDSETSDTSARKAASTVPLPSVGLGLNYQVSPKLSWFLKTEGFALTFDEWNGSYTAMQLGVDYKVTKNFGAGIALSSDNLSVKHVTDEHIFKYDNKLNGINIYLSTMF